VGINSAEPLVTRVVIDLASELPSRLERGTDGRQIRVVLGVDAITAEPVRTKRPPAADAAWCREFARRAEDMLVAPAATTPAAAMVIDAQWTALEADATARAPAQPVERVHSMLLQAVRLARIAVSGTQHPDQAAAARSGARLLLESARAQLAAMP
jgi:hypothetical protein